MSLTANLWSTLNDRKKELEKTICKATKILKRPVQGHLEVNKRGNHYRYYLKMPDISTGKDISAGKDTSAGKEIAEGKDISADKKAVRKYIRDLDMAKALADRDYAIHVLKSANSELKQINALLSIYKNATVEDCFINLNPGRKLLVTPILMDDDQYADDWLSSRSMIKNTYPIQSSILTENGETVRSKSEKIIADKLRLSGVPYKYEEPLILENMMKFPDFTVLNKKTRKVYYWEHMGMMDNYEYFMSAMEKMEIYLRNNIILGKDLIVTYETTNQPVSIHMIETIIKEYLL